MEPLWGRLGELRMAVVVLVGGSDPKYRALGRRMVEQLPRGELMVAAGGHGLALENPAAVVRALERLDP
jgi:pimeloyl-ACP methyl ester carboxylesterase